MGTRCAKGRGTTGAAAAPARGGLYRPRSPHASPLWQCAKRHARELDDAGRLLRAVESQVIERFIECGDPHVVRRILDHLGRWAPEPAGPGPSASAPEWPANALIPLTYHPLPDIA